MTPVCLAAGVLYTLAWTHSVEKTGWEEDWRVENGLLVLVEARVMGSGAGMEPGADAVLEADGFWHWHPKIAPVKSVVLTQSPYTAGYRLCRDGACRPLAELVPGAERVFLTSCPAS